MRTTRCRPADEAGIAEAAEVLRAGGLVAFPTETVYGLGADARSGPAVAAIYAAKGRPRFNPLIAHVTGLTEAEGYGDFRGPAGNLATAFWPGPLTLVVPAQPDCNISALARAGLDSVALRVPRHPVARALIAAAGLPVAAPSANRSGRISPTSAEHVRASLDGRVDFVLDGGAAEVGIESTIVSCLEETPRLLRPGGVSREAIEAVLGRALDGSGGAIVAPGMMASHYAPGATVRLDATTVIPGEAVLDFGGQLRSGQGLAYLDLSPDGSLDEAAANLFDFLHRLDDGSARSIAVAPIPARGLGAAIVDRLVRAAAPRPVPT